MFFLKPPLKNYLLASLLLSFSVSCEMDDQLSAIPDSESLTENIVFDVLEISDTETVDQANLRLSNNILHEINFRESSPLNIVYEQFPSSHSFRVINNPVDSGDKSGKFELRNTDRLSTRTTSTPRAEILFPPQTHNERWYAFSVFFPSEGYAKDRAVEIISQWHQAGGGSPPNSIEVINDNIYLRSLNRNTTANGNSVYTNYPLGTVERGKWNEFVFHFVHASNQNGLIEIWQNGRKIHEIKGPNMRSGFPRPQLKVGIYKWVWSRGESTGTTRRVLYFDDIRIGNENTVLSEISNFANSPNPGSNITAPQQPNGNGGSGSSLLPEISSFSLIAADVDRELGVITSENSFRVNNNKLSIQANIDENFKGHIKFELSGEYSYESTDRVAPFALFRDDGKGNYYFGNGLGPGSYTVKATPIDGEIVGKSKTISFVIRNSEMSTSSLVPEISSFSLIAADIDKEIGVITPGSTISYQNDKLNIRANMDGDFKGHVKFELNGVYSKESIDKTPPFCLFRDDGKGNYYFGRGLQSGNYTITATPIDSNGKSIGKSQTVSFTLRN